MLRAHRSTLQNNVISFKEFVQLVRNDHKEHEGKIFEGLEAVMEDEEEEET